MSGYEELLRAGAVLPPGTRGAGERAVPLTARGYRHPALDGRVVVRLVAEELGAAEDLAAGFLGLEPDGEPAVVGLGTRQALGFPEWVLAHHPEDGQHALAIVPELERVARQAKSKPKAALDAYAELAVRLADSVPHFLPTFYEQAGRVFLSVENAAYAARMFGRARAAEAEHGLEVDEERLDAVFLEFALAGALPVKVLSGYARELAARLPGNEALRRFTRLCVRRTAGGLPPSPQMVKEQRRLARAAGLDADAAERAYLAELLELPATLRATPAWWVAHRPALVALARGDAEVRGRLLDIMPADHDERMPVLWLEVLEETGATAGLTGADGLEDADGAGTGTRPPGDGVVGWLRRFTRLRGTWWRQERLPSLYALVERMADRLRAELAASGERLDASADLDLLDLLLALDIPVADIEDRQGLPLRAWARGEGQRDLVAVAADPRFHRPFHVAADGLGFNEAGSNVVRTLAASPGGRAMLADWVREVARRSATAGLPELPDVLRRLAWLPGEALLLAEDEAREAAAADLAPVLARTLRAGLFDELGWPVWDEAAATLVPADHVEDLYVADAWPYLIVAGRDQARVIGAEGTALVHDLRVPAGALGTWDDPGLHWVDGELLVYWADRRNDGQVQGYWHTAADRPRPMERAASASVFRGTRMTWYRGTDPVTLPLPGGGRATGAGILHRGDATVPGERPVISDGVSYWVWVRGETDRAATGWYAYDPAGGRHDRRGLPGFLADAPRDAPGGSAFVSGWVLPAFGAGPGPCGAPVDGLLGWRVVRLPDGSLRGQDLAGHTVTVPPGSDQPSGLVLFPGDDRPRAVVAGYNTVGLVDPDGVVTSTARIDAPPGPFARGTRILPPRRYWHFLRPRDPEGSAALRGVDRETAAALLAAAKGGTVTEEALREEVRRVLPRVTHDALVAGVAGVVRFAAARQASLDTAAARLTEALEAGGRAPEEQKAAGPGDAELVAALDGLWHTGGSGDSGSTYVVSTLRAIGRAVAEPRVPDPGDPARPPRMAGAELPHAPAWHALLGHGMAAVAFRAAAATTGEADRGALSAFLAELGALGLTGSGGPARWRRLTLFVDRDRWLSGTGAHTNGRGLLPLDDDGALIALLRATAVDGGYEFRAVFHDPSGRFEVPAPFVVRHSAPVGDDGAAGRAAELLTELEARGPAPWFPGAAEEFAALTGVTAATAALVVAGLPRLDTDGRGFLPPGVRETLGVKAADAAVARDQLRALTVEVRRALVAALLPESPARLWTDGPDAAAAAGVWLREVGRKPSVPEAVLGEAVRVTPEAGRWLPALLDPAGDPLLVRDLEWEIREDRAWPTEDVPGFTADVLVGTVSMAAWLAHRLPAGDAMRAALPAALAAVRDRLAAPGLMLDLGRFVSLPAFRKVAGHPTETGEGFERYGAVVMATHDDEPAPAIRVALLDDEGNDPFLPVLRAEAGPPFPPEAAMRMVRDPRFGLLLADPGDPAGGERDRDGTWWPQDPSRSVPELVAEAAGEHGLGTDAAALYLMLLAMPDPTDRHVARWTGWKPARLRAARAELAATGLVVEGSRTRAGRSLFLPGGWVVSGVAGIAPLERWKLPMTDLLVEQDDGRVAAPLGVVVPGEPAADLYRRAWQRVREGDVPRLEELAIRRGRRR
ncbi:DNA-binding protein [Streptomyces sp. URMC 129]|uniref:DNA-binding protein n=1 Tax=Streptomyces sp. URMC 129 TaxID=3423407 RepID=UPI003F1DBDAF